MIQIDTISQEGYEKVIHVTEPESGLDCVIAIHNISKSKDKAICSIKFEDYSSQNLQIEKTLKYAESMSKKVFYAGLPYIGGSITINNGTIKSLRKALDELSSVLQSHKESIIAFIESQIDELAIEHLCDINENVINIDSELYYKAQAKGAYYSIRALQQFLHGNKNVKYKHIVINGVGSLGSELAQLLERAGANITVCDSNQQNINDLYAHMHFGTCTVEEAHTVPSDLYILCGPSDQLDKKSTFELKASRVLGVTDAQLTSNKAGYNMHGKDIVYVPDFVAGVGGIIAIAKQEGKTKKTLDKDLDLIFTRTLSLLNHSSKNRKPPFIIAEQQMTEKLQPKKVKEIAIA
tara:strand:- start:237 stop:1286 length:1050 start_codon:yes stop_codon:yes gene_type:complete